MLAVSKRVQRVFGQNGPLRKILFDLLCNLELLYLSRHKDRESLQLIQRIRKERESLITVYDAYLIYSLARAQSRLPGEMAEVGVYQGTSARLLCEAKGNRRLHLFDTFEGLPEPQDFERPLLKPTQFSCTLESVKDYLKAYDNVSFYKGYFPDTAEPVKDVSFSFVNLDVDLYKSTLDGLGFFYPRVRPGGIILSHDYSILDGVKMAFDEFFADKPEHVIDLPSTQCMVLKQ